MEKEFPEGDEQVQEEVVALRRFAIDLEWFPTHLRSFSELAHSRMCESCQARLGTESEERVPRTDASGKMSFEVVRTRYGDDPIAVISEHCARQPDYRSTRLPVMEIVFRLLLGNRNQLIELEELTQLVIDWVRPGDGRVINSTVMDRLILADEYYGIQQVEEEMPAQVGAASSG